MNLVFLLELCIYWIFVVLTQNTFFGNTLGRLGKVLMRYFPFVWNFFFFSFWEEVGHPWHSCLRYLGAGLEDYSNSQQSLSSILICCKGEQCSVILLQKSISASFLFVIAWKHIIVLLRRWIHGFVCEQYYFLCFYLYSVQLRIKLWGRDCSSVVGMSSWSSLI